MSNRARSSHYAVRLDPSAFCLFGFLLDSIDGLATHRQGDSPDEMFISVGAGQEEAWNLFLDAWRRSFPQTGFILTECATAID